MSTNQQAVDAAAAVETARRALSKLRAIESMLATELPAAQAALASAEKKLRELTKPTKAATRKAELDLLHAKITAAKQTEVVTNGNG